MSSEQNQNQSEEQDVSPQESLAESQPAFKAPAADPSEYSASQPQEIPADGLGGPAAVYQSPTAAGLGGRGGATSPTPVRLAAPGRTESGGTASGGTGFRQPVLGQAAYAVFLVAAVFFSAALGALGGGYGVYLVTSRKNAASVQTIPAALPAPTQPAAVISVSNSAIETAITAAVQKVGPAVVTVVGTVPGQQTFFGVTSSSEVSGSGIIISADGYIVTNNHVVDGTESVSVILADGTQLSAKIVSTDMYADLAVLKADGQMPSVASFGNSDNLRPGETVIAIGSPLGDFKNTVTVGVISATGRRLDTGNGYQMEDMLQTDAAVNEGNSGGTLVNLAGEVIGVNTLIVRGGGMSTVAEGLGFAITANTTRTIAEQIVQKGFFCPPQHGD